MIAYILIYVCVVQDMEHVRAALGVRWKRRCQDFTAGQTCLSQIAARKQRVTRVHGWGHGDMLSYSRKIKLTSRLVHRHVLGYVGRSAWRRGMLQPKTRIATHRRISCQYHRGSSLENLQCQQRIRSLENTPCRASTGLGLLL